MSLRFEIIRQLSRVAEEQNRTLASLNDDLPLLQSGLDSLCLAVLVARLEDLLHVDPFGSAEDAAFPVTVGDFIAVYERAVGAMVHDDSQLSAAGSATSRI